MNEDRGTRYQRLRRRTTVAGAAWSLALPAALVASGAHVRLAGFWADLSSALLGTTAAAQVTSAALFGACLAALHETILVPILLFGHYRLDRRYGVTDQPPGAWLRSHVAAALGIVAGAGLAAAGITSAARVWPAAWWVPAWLAAMAAAAAAVRLAPRWMLPAKGLLTPLDRPDLAARLQALAVRFGAGAPPVLVWRTRGARPRSWAFLAGAAHERRIVLADRLVEASSDDEIAVVVAHELAHHARHDIRATVAADGAVVATALAGGAFVVSRWGGVFGVYGAHDPAAVAVLLLVALAVGGALRPFVTALSRWQERRADRAALAATGAATAFGAAVRRMAAAMLADEDPPALVRWWFYAHPPVADRLALAREWARTATPSRG